MIFPKIHIEIEKWKFNKNYNIYVSNMGNFKDKNKDIINLKISHQGYMQVPICNNKRGIIKYIQAHRAVMETWCPRADMWKAKLTVDHLNHNKRENKIKNLEWVTAEENQKRATEDNIILDSEKEIQRLQNRIQELEKRIQEQDEKIYIVDNNKNILYTFNNWNEVKNFLPFNTNIQVSHIMNKIKNSIKNNKQYFKYNWKIGG